MKNFAFAVIILVFVLYLIFSYLDFYYQEERDEKLAELNRKIEKANEFKLSSYFTRIEQEFLSIQQKKEQAQKELLTLWWGLDGLRLNDDGTTEWIKRENDKPKPISVSYSPCQSIMPGATQLAYDPCRNQIENQIQALQNLYMQQQMALQNQQMINCIHAGYMQVQSPYYQSPYYQSPYYQSPYYQSPYYCSPITQCCYRPY